MEGDFCFRCGINFSSEDWSESSINEKYLDLKCKECGQGYFKEKGKSLIECRRVSSFTTPLYYIERYGYDGAKIRIPELACATVKHNHIKWLKIFISDIEEELLTPNLELNKIFDSNVTEKDTRSYLSDFLLEVKRILSSEDYDNI